MGQHDPAGPVPRRGLKSLQPVFAVLLVAGALIAAVSLLIVVVTMRDLGDADPAAPLSKQPQSSAAEAVGKKTPTLIRCERSHWPISIPAVEVYETRPTRLC